MRPCEFPEPPTQIRCSDGYALYTCPHCRRVCWIAGDPARFGRMCRSDATRGLGESVAAWIHRLSGGRIKPCAACLRRMAWLNWLWPYRRSRSWWLRRWDLLS